ncbi:glyoxalase/bleomycin resistance/dioxygenase family protein [Rhodococcus hoagii]|nr:glyoxalase/bleomycin resistance/dioxygenase family protein [Prescottella equi]
MSRAQLALNVDDLEEAVTFYSKLFGTRPAKLKPGYANFAIAEPPLKLVLLENPARAARSTTSAWRSNRRRRSTRRSRGSPTRACHRRGDRHHLLLRHAGQGVGHRAGRREVGGLHRARRLGDLRFQPPTSGRPREAQGDVCCGTDTENESSCC